MIVVIQGPVPSNKLHLTVCPHLTRAASLPASLLPRPAASTAGRFLDDRRMTGRNLNGVGSSGNQQRTFALRVDAPWEVLCRVR